MFARKTNKHLKDFWMRYLTECRSTSISSYMTNAHGGHVKQPSLTVDRVFVTPLAEFEALSSSINGTLTLTTQAVFGIIMVQALRTRDVVFGAVLSKRTVPMKDPHTIVPPCITTIPQRVNLDIGSPAS